jgi:hypothetical protein
MYDDCRVGNHTKQAQKRSIKEVVNQNGCAGASHHNSVGKETKICRKFNNCIYIHLLLKLHHQLYHQFKSKEIASRPAKISG